MFGTQCDGTRNFVTNNVKGDQMIAYFANLFMTLIRDDFWTCLNYGLSFCSAYEKGMTNERTVRTEGNRENAPR